MERDEHQAHEDVLLEIRRLETHFFTPEGVVKAVDGVDLAVRRGRTLCVVGESGSGKSVMAHSILQVVGQPGRIVGGEILLRRRTPGDPPGTEEVDLATLDPKGGAIRAIRGREIAMIFQEPMTSLSPVHTIGNQLVEGIRLHFDVTREEARARGIEALRQVGISSPETNIDAYTFRLSGGMRQRAMIAIALACEPSLLIADEPTTALDVTTQAQILELMRGLQRDLETSIMLITHDLGVVAEIADDVAVMYLGNVVERGSVDEVFHDPKHPYTRALLRSIPKLSATRSREPLPSIKGMVPHPFNRPTGCPFHTRCDAFMPGLCDRVVPPAVPVGGGRAVRCLLYGGAELPGPRTAALGAAR
jgi:peptide/nickel transport system ATP-binding protein